MTRQILSRLTSYDLSESNAKQNTVYLRVKDNRGLSERGIRIHNVTVEKILPILIEDLKTRGLQGSWRVEDPPLTTQLVALAKRLDPLSLPKPSCQKCGKDLEVGQEIISLGTKGRRRHYHSLCYESTFH